MYRIEVVPGEETVFRTIEELAVGIRNGVITPRARIYHHASQKWLPIGLHPHYKKALDMPAASAASVPVTTATPLPTPSATRPIPEARPASRASAELNIPAPVQSPVVAMQKEILRDLPVVSIPEPLPWTVPAPHSPGSQFEALAPPTVVYAPRTALVTAQPLTAQVTMRPADVVHSPARHAAARHASVERPVPVAEHQVAFDEELLPRPAARRSRRAGGAPVMLLGAAAALVICTHLVLTSTSPASADPSEAPPARASDSRASEGTGQTTMAETVAPVAPARVPMTPGPAFAGSVPARPGDSLAIPKARPPAPLNAPAPTSPTGAAGALAPAPATLELTLPDLSADSVLPANRLGDTLGMKKILRALNGANPAGGQAAP